MREARALPILFALAASAAPSFAQSLACHPIRRGESAGQAARRVTGDSRNMYSASFQIMNDASKFIPKSQYDRLYPGWHACLVRPSVHSTASNERRVDPPAVVAIADEAPLALASRAVIALAPPVVLAPPIAVATAGVTPRRIGNVDLTLVWLALAIAVPWFGFQFLDGYFTRRKTASVLRQLYANRFISEFERPLILYDDTEPPLKTRVRGARRGRFEILLAPGPGRRYPNLTDHKRNVEYDVDRVLHALDDDAFVNGALYTQHGWVVVPFQPRPGPKQPGVTCRFSF